MLRMWEYAFSALNKILKWITLIRGGVLTQSVLICLIRNRTPFSAIKTIKFVFVFPVAAGSKVSSHDAQ